MVCMSGGSKWYLCKDRRIQQANLTMARIGKALWNQKTPRSRLKMKMIMTFVYPTVAYGCETWCLNSETKKHLDAWWMRILRRIKGVTKLDRLRSNSRTTQNQALVRNNRGKAVEIFRPCVALRRRALAKIRTTSNPTGTEKRRKASTI